MEFSDAGLMDRLEVSSIAELEALTFGVIKMDREGRVTGYNRVESEASGLSPARVLGRDFFADVGPCMNNYLVSQRFTDEPELDAEIDYVFTLRMKPTPVRLRMLKSARAGAMYLLVRR